MGKKRHVVLKFGGLCGHEEYPSYKAAMKSIRDDFCEAALPYVIIKQDPSSKGFRVVKRIEGTKKQLMAAEKQYADIWYEYLKENRSVGKALREIMLDTNDLRLGTCF